MVLLKVFEALGGVRQVETKVCEAVAHPEALLIESRSLLRKD